MRKFRKFIKKIHREVDGIIGYHFGRSPYLSMLSKTETKKITLDNFSEFTYSKLTHFQNFHIMPIYQRQTPATCDLKVYQDLFVYTFILENIPKGSKILEVGGGDSRIIPCLRNDYEFWNLDKIEGQGHGPKVITETKGYFLVKDYIGAFSKQLPNHYFDLIYSISAMEHFPTDEKAMDDIILDLQRLMKKNSLSLHCVDAVLNDNDISIHPLINKIKSSITNVSIESNFDKIRKDKNLWTIPNYAYLTRWFHLTKKGIREFGRPFSLNIGWQNFH